MPRYFMHLVDGSDVLLDAEGIERASDAMPAAALFQARDCMAGDVRNGCLDLGYRIDVHDDTDTLVHSVAFKDALDIVRSG